MLDLSCTNTTVKKCASSAHRKLKGEERRRQEGEQLLVRGIGEVRKSAVDPARHGAVAGPDEDRPVSSRT